MDREFKEGVTHPYSLIFFARYIEGGVASAPKLIMQKKAFFSLVH